MKYLTKLKNVLLTIIIWLFGVMALPFLIMVIATGQQQAAIDALKESMERE